MREFPSAPQNRTDLKAWLAGHPHPGGVIVCPDRKWIYMKPCKTAGTSILRGVLDGLPLDLIGLKDQPDRFRKWLDELTDQDLKSYFIFSVIRNPWDRFVSAASYFRMSVDQFIADWEAGRLRERARIHALPIHFYTHLNSKPFVDVLIDFENLDGDFPALCRRLGLPDVRLPHRNRSRRRAYPGYYSPQNREKVAGFYAEDLALYGYAFDENASAGPSGGWISRLAGKLGFSSR